MRSWVTLIFVVLAVVVASAVTVTQLRARDHALSELRDRASLAGATAVEESLHRRWKALSDQVSILATSEQLRLGIATDAQTVRNQIAEEGLRELRDREVLAVAHVNAQLPGHADWAVSVGLAPLTDDAITSSPPVVAALAAANAPSTGAIALPSAVALVAVAPVASHDQLSRGYLLIGDLLNAKTLGPLAAETRTAISLSDGRHSLGFAGLPSAEPLLTSAGGGQGAAVPFDADAGWVSRMVTLGADAQLWVATSIAQEQESLQRATELKLALTWLISLAIAAALALLVRRRSGTQRQAVAAGSQPSAQSLPSSGGTGGTGSGAASSGAMPAGTTPPPRPSQTSPPAIPGASTAPELLLDQSKVFGRYKLLDLLGMGGMAEVWTAVAYGAEGFRRPVVVKRIRRDMSSEAVIVQDFIDEANLASQLVHSNIVPIFDLGNVNGDYYLAQEYILGRDLAKITAALHQRGQRLDPTLATYVLAEALKALDYAHTLHDKAGRPLGIVHRDISPSNIVISTRGEVKIIDFGIAKSVSKVGQTAVGTVKGNPRFMSPEQAMGQPTDGRSDLFSLAMSILYTQTGASLYTATAILDLIRQAAAGPGPWDIEEADARPAPLNGLLGKALAPGVEDRYLSAMTFLEIVLPRVPADGARRLSALLHELFGEELKAQERRFGLAIDAGASAPGVPEETLDGTFPRTPGSIRGAQS